jgi:hypothetical protein
MGFDWMIFHDPPPIKRQEKIMRIRSDWRRKSLTLAEGRRSIRSVDLVLMRDELADLKVELKGLSREY